MKAPHLCETMALLLERGERVVTYSDRFREYGIPYGDASYQTLLYCPWCGTRLPESLRDDWFARLEALGLEPSDPSIPEELATGEWWRRESASNE